MVLQKIFKEDYKRNARETQNAAYECGQRVYCNANSRKATDKIDCGKSQSAEYSADNKL